MPTDARDDEPVAVFFGEDCLVDEFAFVGFELAGSAFAEFATIVVKGRSADKIALDTRI